MAGGGCKVLFLSPEYSQTRNELGDRGDIPFLLEETHWFGLLLNSFAPGRGAGTKRGSVITRPRRPRSTRSRRQANRSSRHLPTSKAHIWPPVPGLCPRSPRSGRPAPVLSDPVGEKRPPPPPRSTCLLQTHTNDSEERTQVIRRDGLPRRER